MTAPLQALQQVRGLLRAPPTARAAHDSSTASAAVTAAGKAWVDGRQGHQCAEVQTVSLGLQAAAATRFGRRARGPFLRCGPCPCRAAVPFYGARSTRIRGALDRRRGIIRGGAREKEETEFLPTRCRRRPRSKLPPQQRQRRLQPSLRRLPLLLPVCSCHSTEEPNAFRFFVFCCICIV